MKDISYGLKTNNSFKLLLNLNAFLTGSIIMAMEMTGSRFLTPFFGSSVYTWASIISIVLLALAIGYFAGGYLAEFKPKSEFLGLFVYLAAIFILLVPIYYVPLFDWLYDISPNTRIGSFAGALLTLFFPLSLLGVFSPFAVKLGSTYSLKTGKIAGSLYAISTIGSIIGTIGVTFFLIPYFGSKNISIGLSIITFLSAVSLFIFDLKANYTDKTNQKNKKAIWFRIVGLITIYIVLSIIVISKTNIMKNNSASSKYILEEVESEYNNIIIKQKDEFVTMSFHRFNSSHVESRMNILNEYELPLSYSQIMPAGLLYVTNPSNLLMIGLGGGMITTYIQRYFPKTKITGVELDGEVVKMARKYFKLSEKKNYTIEIADGRIFMHNTKDIYDIIMVDAYKGGYIPFHLCTQEFYAEAKKHLSEKGCMVLNLHRGSELYGSIITTLSKVFQNIDIYGSDTKGNAVAIVYDGEKKSIEELQKTAGSLQVENNFYHNINKLIKLKVASETLPKGELLTDDFAPVNFLNAINEHNAKDE